MDQSARTILLIEDNPGDARLIQEMLRDANDSSFALHWVESLAAGIAFLAHHSPVIILLDLSLPDSFGLATFEAVNSQAPDVPIVVLTGLNDEDAAISALRHGAQDYLVKGPVDSSLLVRALRYAIERKRIELDNVRLYRQAQEALRLRDMVLSSVSHDLRGPLTAVKVIAGTLKWQIEQGLLAAPDPTAPRGSPQGYPAPRTPPLAPELATAAIKGLGRIDANADRMAGQIEELLDVARLQLGGELQLRRQRVDLVAVTRALIADYQQRTHRHQLTFEADGDNLVGRWDLARLERVIGNLLANAIKYSFEGGDIHVRVNQKEHDGQRWAALTVQDQGAGIPSAELPRIFTWFHRGANVAERVAGSGIGLPGAKRIVELHGGSLSVESQEGVGSRFTLRLPLSSPLDLASQEEPLIE